jgi:redox-sensing transcriptional repressor
LGRALLSYGGFKSYGINIAAAFDVDGGIVGSEIGPGKIRVFETSLISSLCRRLNIHIGIIAVPPDQAQLVCDRMVAGGILAIWNFVPVRLAAPNDILVQNEDMAASLALLSKHLRERMLKV